MNVSPEVCNEIIRQFDSQGWHRTASASDELSGRWLLERLEAAGVPGHEVPFAFTRTDLDESLICLGEKSIAAVPLIDSCLPDRGAVIRGSFGERNEPGTIALVQFGAHGMAGDLEAFRTSAHTAVIACVSGPAGGISVLNAWHYEAPKGPPIVQAPGSEWDALEEAQRAGMEIEIHCGATRIGTKATNIRAEIYGADRNLAPLIVLTHGAAGGTAPENEVVAWPSGSNW